MVILNTDLQKNTEQQPSNLNAGVADSIWLRIVYHHNVNLL